MSVLIEAGRRLRSIVCLAALLVGAQSVPAVAADALAVGDHAPALELADLGGTVRKAVWGDGAPAATVIYFFDPQSPDCLLEMSLLGGLYQRARDLGLAVYAVEVKGRQPAEVSRSMERYCAVYGDPPFPVLPDPSFRAGRTYGVAAAPVTFIAESHGVILNRFEGYGHDTAVAVARRIEQLLRRDRGFLSPVLRDAGISEAEEQGAEARMAAAAAAASGVSTASALGQGARAPEFEFTDVTGRAGSWRWSSGAASGPRIVAFFAGLSLASIEVLNWLDGLARRGRDAGLEVLAVEASGQDAAAVQASLDKYRRYNPDPSFPVVPDPSGKLTRLFGPWETLPQTYLIAADGTVIYRAEGFSAGEGEIIAGKTERAYLLKGRPFPSAGSAGASVAPPAGEDEAPSIRKRQEQADLYQSSIVQADAAFMAWNFDRAFAFYKAALAVQPNDLHALVRSAQIHERRGEPSLALEVWERVLAVRPDHAEAAARIRELRVR
jgi:peroxiredoxin